MGFRVSLGGALGFSRKVRSFANISHHNPMNATTLNPSHP